MSAMRLAELLPDVPGIPAELAIDGLVMDSRAVAPGYGFVAIAGFGTHGLAFAEQARGPFPELQEAVEKFDPDGEDISASYDGESRTASLSLPAGSNILRLR